MTTGAFVSAAVDSVLRQEVGSQSFLSRKQQKIKFSATRYPRRTAQAASGSQMTSAMSLAAEMKQSKQATTIINLFRRRSHKGSVAHREAVQK